MLKDQKTILAISLIVLAALSRFIPHPFNFTAISAMALFGGALIKDKKLALFIPLAAMLVSDIFIGFHQGMFIVYFAFFLTGILGLYLGKDVKIMKVLGASVIGTLGFYLITNFAFLYSAQMYSHDIAGIITSYVAGLPFLRNALLGDLFYNALLFGSFYFVNQKISKPIIAN